jgi:hypothetical protein
MLRRLHVKLVHQRNDLLGHGTALTRQERGRPDDVLPGEVFKLWKQLD